MRFIDFDSTGRRTGKGQKQKIRFRVPHAQQIASAPTLSFGDGDTGMWEPQDDVLQFGTAGNQKLEINASGQVGIGGITPIYDLHVGSAAGGHYFQRYASDASPPTLCLDKSRHDTIGSHTIVADNDVLGAIIFKGSDGSAFRNAAVIRCDVDGTPGSSDMPGELLFQVTPDGSATAATAMTISPDKTVTLAGNLVVSGTTTTIDSTTLTVDDKNIELGSVGTPTDTTADGGGITLKGATDKTINWVDSTDMWTFNQPIHVTSADNTLMHLASTDADASLKLEDNGSGHFLVTVTDDTTIIGTNGYTDAIKLTSDSIIFNESQNDRDFRVESDITNNALYVHGLNGKVGVGTAAPNDQLEVMELTGDVFVRVTSVTDGSKKLGLRLWGDRNWQIVNDGAATYGTADSLVIHDATSNATRVEIDTNGKTSITGALDVCVDNEGHDVKFFGSSSCAYTEYDVSANELEIRGPAATRGKLLLSTAETTVVDGNKLGQIDFQAPLDSAGTDAILVGASIWAEADATFAADNNSTELVFATGASETAAEKMRITSDGNVGVGTASPDTATGFDSPCFEVAGSEPYIVLSKTGADSIAIVNHSSILKFINDTDDRAFFQIHQDAPGDSFVVDATGNVGIGTTAAERHLHVRGAAEVQALFENPSTTASQFAYVDIESNATSAGESIIRFKTPDGTSYINSKGSATTMTFSSGNVGIANTAPADKLWVQGGISATGDITSSASDKRLKENRKPISNAVEKVLKLKGITYDWIDNISEVTGTEWNHTEKQAGLIAQDVQKVLPEAVSIAPFDKDGEGKSVSGKDYLTIDYARVVPLLVNAIKEQQVQIEELKKEIKE